MTFQRLLETIFDEPVAGLNKCSPFAAVSLCLLSFDIVKFGSKIFDLSSALMPTPESATMSSTRIGSSRAQAYRRNLFGELDRVKDLLLL